jgi:hypothetical protein
VKPTKEAFKNGAKMPEPFRSPQTGVDLIVPYVKSARGIVPHIRGLNPLAGQEQGRKMQRPRVEARALIARLKVHGVAFDSARRAVVCIDSDAWHRTAEIGTVCRFASADSLRMGDGPVTEWISWPLRPEQADRAAVLRNDALRVVLEWLRCELPWCLTWAPVLGVIAQVATGIDSKPPATLRGDSACRAMLATNRPPR